MAKTVNQVFLLGNVGQDPEVRKTGKGTKVANFSLATQRLFGDKRTDWHKCTAWGKLAELVETYIKKGDKLHIIGEIQYQPWTDDSGTNRSTTDIVVKELTMLGNPTGYKKKEKVKEPLAEPEDTDLPF